MALRPDIILSGQQPNFLKTLATAATTAGLTNQVQDQNALRGLYREQGAGLVNNDPNAINALAGLNPEKALGIKDTHSAMAERQERLRLARAAGARAAAAAKRTMSDREAKEAAERMRRAIVGGQGIESEPDWDAWVTKMGAPQLVGEFGNKDLHAASLLTMAEHLESNKPQSSAGKTQADINAGFLPEGTPLRPTGVTVNTGGQDIPGLSKLDPGYTYLYDTLEDGKSKVRLDEMGRPIVTTIPGSKAARELEEAGRSRQEDAAQAAEAGRQADLSLGVNMKRIQENIAQIEKGDTVLGVTGAIARRVPGSEAANFGERHKAISTRGALDEIQNMRDNSKSGGAVGSLTDAEREAIAVAATALSLSQSDEEYLKNARAFRKLALDIAYGEGLWEIDEKTGAISFPSLESIDFSKMAVDDFINFDLTNASPEQRAAWIKRHRELGL